MGRLPSPSKPWLHTWAPLLLAGFAGFTAILGAVAAAWKAVIDARAGQSWVLPALVTAVLIAVFAREVLSLHRAFMEARRQGRFEEAHELQAACQVLREQLGSRFRSEVDALPVDRRPTAIRVCVYRVAPVGKELSPELERVTPYAVGEGGDPGEVGKRISSACGVIGLSYRTQYPQIGNRKGESIEDFRREMIAEWGFDPVAARTLNETRWSFLAFPIQSPEGKVDAVVFFDSELKNCFMVEVVESFVMPACDAMRIVIERRYGNVG